MKDISMHIQKKYFYYTWIIRLYNVDDIVMLIQTQISKSWCTYVHLKTKLMIGINSIANIIRNLWISDSLCDPGNATFYVSKNWSLEQDSQWLKKKKRKEKLQLVSIQMQTLVLRQRIPEHCWDLDWLVVYQAVIIFPAVWKNGAMTCRSCIITLEKTLDHCKKNFELDSCLNFYLLSQAEFLQH